MKLVKHRKETITVEYTAEDVARILTEHAKSQGNFSRDVKFESEQITYGKEVAKKNQNKQHTVSASVVLVNPNEPNVKG